MSTPEIEGYELEWVGQSCRNRGAEPDTCNHDNLMTYEEDDGRFCGCRDCGTIWEMHEKDE